MYAITHRAACAVVFSPIKALFCRRNQPMSKAGSAQWRKKAPLEVTQWLTI